MNLPRLVDTMELRGVALVASLLSPKDVAALKWNLRECGFGTRDLLTRESVCRIATSPHVKTLIERLIGRGAFAVRAIWFDKTEDANWKVVWHQDRAIAVAARLEANDFGPWSLKQGVQHTLAPAAILEGMVSLRIHLDTCDTDNAPLRVIPGSHRFGVIAENDIAVHRRQQETECTAEAGDAILMRPLLLHASSPSKKPGHRRVIHIEYAAHNLPNGLEWHARVS
jgi:ectoine hydroxylase-related dioxygenase (phytanoyl-CoA dioxygenase family)